MEAPCPRCREAIRLTPSELADTKGFCGLCGTRFRIECETVGQGPARTIEIPRLNAESSDGAVHRAARCPRCGRRGSLSANELRQKRSYCAACESDFDITPDRLVSDAVAPLTPAIVAAIDAAPNRRITELLVRPGTTRFRIEHVLPDRFKNPTTIGGAFLFLGMFIVPTIICNFDWRMIGISMLVAAPLIWRLIRLLAGFEEIVISTDHLIVRRGAPGLVLTTRIPLAAIAEVAPTAERLEVRLSPNGKVLPLGQDLRGSDQASIQWLGRRIQRAIALARGERLHE